MPRILSNTARRAMYAQESSEVWITLITISHPNFVEDIRVCDDATELLPVAGIRGIVSRGDEFMYVPFSLTLPSSDDTGVATAVLSIDNIDRRVIKAVREADSALAVKIEIILASDPESVEIEIDDFRLAIVPYDAFTVSGELTQEYYELEPFPHQRVTPSNFAGVF